MARPLSDSSKIPGGLFDAKQDLPTQPGKEPLSVSQVARLIQGTVVGLGKIVVVGEVSVSALGKKDTHCYFQLKDDASTISCVMWKSTLAKSAIKPTQGARVVIEGMLDFYTPGGRLNLIANRIELVGEGALEAKFRAMCDELRGLGYFLDQRKRPLPPVPKGVAIITSFGAAALQDCLTTAQMRFPSIPLVIVGVPVQGSTAAAAVAKAIEGVNDHAQRLGVDVIVVTRGGGSREDLQPFNERLVADAAFKSGLPLVAAIGHESDTSVLDLVADHRASTPTQAMMAVIPDRKELAGQLAALVARLVREATQSILVRKSSTDSLASRACLRDASGLLQRPRERIEQIVRRSRYALQTRLQRGAADVAAMQSRLSAFAPKTRVEVGHANVSSLVHRLTRSTAHRFQRWSDQVLSFSARLDSVAPERTLARGYSITFDEAGRPVQNAASVPSGSLLTTRLHNGELRSRTEPNG